MSKFLKWSLIVVASVLLVGYVGFRYMTVQTKKSSPEETSTFSSGDLTLTVNYSRPFTKGRAIFGGLVPYGKVWRTGANEATTLEANRDFHFGGTALKAGKYTLWTIPGPKEWTVILNGNMYGWGLNFNGGSPRDPLADVAQEKVAVRQLTAPAEQFTIALEGTPSELTLSWDDVQVGVPVH